MLAGGARIFLTAAMMKRALLICLALTACEEVPTSPEGQEVAAPLAPFTPRQPEVADSSDPCSAGAYLGLIGRPASTIGLAETETFRLLPPDFVPVEGDVNPRRLNVRINAGGVVDRVSCG